MRPRPTLSVASQTAAAGAARLVLAIAFGALLGAAPAPDEGRSRASDTPPDGPITLQRIGASGGSSQGLAVVGDRIYLGVGMQLEVLQRPAGAFERTGIIDVGVGVTAVAAGDGTLWVGGTDGTVRRYDLADANRPAPTAVVDLTPAAADGAAGDPSSVVALAIGDGRLFAALGDHGLAVVAFEAGRPPRLAARLMDGTTVTDLGALGSIGYVADGPRGLVVVDATDADRIVEGAVVPFGDLEPAQLFGVKAGPVAVDASTHRLYVAVCSGVCGFRPSPAVIDAYDVADPLSPLLLGQVATEYTYATDIALTDGHAYLAIAQCGPSCRGAVESFERSADGTLIAVTSPSVWDGGQRFVTALGVDSTGAVIASERSGGVTALSSDAPFVAADWSYVGDPAAVAFQGGRMVAVDADTRTVRTIDIADPTGPRPSGAWAPGDTDGDWANAFATSTTAVALDGRLAVVADSVVGALVLDVGPAASIARVGRAEVPSASAAALRGDDAFVGTIGDEGSGRSATVVHLDLSRPAAPIVGVAATLPRAVTGLSLVDDTLWALLCGIQWSVVGLDVRTPGAPVVLGTPTDLEGVSRPVMADGRLAIGLAEGGGIDVFDLAMPPAPRLIARLPVAGTVLGLWHGLVYTARDGAVDVYRVADGAPLGAAAAPIATYAVPGYVPTAWQPGWVDDAGRVVVNQWGSGWTVLATAPLTMRGQAWLPIALRP